ncbi:MAG: dephospho-CoA kinase [Roseivirga sp.]|jgi:dephospho-CoA kinase
MNRPLVVGVTGGIGSGKSTVCLIFEALGMPVYYADDRGKFLLVTDENLKNEVVEVFGQESYDSEGGLNRVYLAARVFEDETELAKLNSLVHPAVAIDFKNWTKQQSSRIVLKEAALLIENGSFDKLDYLISVIAPEVLRVERVLMRDAHRSKAQVNKILAKQVNDTQRKRLSHWLILNDGKELITPQVLSCLSGLQELALMRDGKEI